MKLIRQDQSIHVDKTNGTEVDYYLLDDAEIHYNKINPHTLQEWHRHRHISENIFEAFRALELCPQETK